MFLKNRNISSKIQRSKVTDYAALIAIGKISYDAYTGNTCSIVGLIPKIKQNFIFPLPVPKTIVCVWGGGGLGNTMSFSLILISINVYINNKGPRLEKI